MKYLYCLLLLSANNFTKSNAQALIKIEDINKHIGDTVKICTKIYGGQFFTRLQNNPPTYMLDMTIQINL